MTKTKLIESKHQRMKPVPRTPVTDNGKRTGKVCDYCHTEHPKGTECPVCHGNGFSNTWFQLVNGNLPYAYNCRIHFSDARTARTVFDATANGYNGLMINGADLYYISATIAGTRRAMYNIVNKYSAIGARPTWVRAYITKRDELGHIITLPNAGKVGTVWQMIRQWYDIEGCLDRAYIEEGRCTSTDIEF